MPSDIETIGAIERNLAGMQSYGFWTVGLTPTPDMRERDLDYPSFWRFWETDTPQQAGAVRNYFLHKGMRDDGEHGEGARYVYLY